MKHNFEKDYLKAARRAARETFGFEPERTHSSRKAYNRQKVKLSLRNEMAEEYNLAY